MLLSFWMLGKDGCVLTTSLLHGQFREKLNQRAHISKPSYFNINGFVLKENVSSFITID